MVFFLISMNSHADEENGFDVPGALKASEILPVDLIRNEFFTVREEVTWFDGLNLFTVDTEYSSFEIWGEPKLRVRLKEFIAWNELQETSIVEAAVTGVGRTALRSINALLMAFAHPITTIKGVPEGIHRMFKEIDRDFENIAAAFSGKKDDESPGALDRRDNEVSEATEAVESLMRVGRSYRLWAHKVGVNPYTSNVAIKEELNRVAKADAYLGTSTLVLAPDIIKNVEVKIVAQVSRSIYKDDWHEVVDNNKKSLRKMGVEEGLIDIYLNHDSINLSLSTLIVETLNDLGGVKDQALVIEQAILLETEAEAIWFAESLLMAQWFHSNEAPIEKMLPDTLVPVALTKDGRVMAKASRNRATISGLTGNNTMKSYLPNA
jgi:hypothetical protein